MSATVHLFPGNPRAPRTESLSFLEQELIAAEKFLDDLGNHLAAARRGGLVTEERLREAAQAAEGALFHLLTADGALNESRDLRNLLNRRMADREASRG
jgi:hypothetical protein